MALLCAGAAAIALWLAACTPETPQSLSRAAQQHIDKGDYRAAQIELRNAIRLAPEDAEAYRLLGLAFLKNDELAGAEAALRKARALGAPADRVVPMLGESLLRLGRYADLISEFEGTVLQDPAASASLQTTIGSAWLARGNTQRAAQAFAAALVSVPQYPLARLGEARVAAAQGRPDVALTAIEGVLNAAPGLAQAHVLKAQLLFIGGDTAGALASLEKAAAADPTNLPARLALVSMHVREGEFDRAKAALEAIGPLKSNEPVVLFLRALVAMHTGDIARARDLAGQIRRQAPRHVPTLNLSAQIELKAGDLTAAESLLRQAIRLQPSAKAPRQLLVATLVRQGHAGKAIEMLQPLLQQPDPDNRDLLLAGEAYLASGDLERASGYFEQAKAKRPDDSAARLRLSQIALIRGQVDSGIDELESSSAAEAGIGAADLMLVTLHLRRQEPQKALEVAETLIRKSPQNPVGHVLAGRSQLMLKDATRARQHFEAALSIQADHLPALEGLADVALLEGRPAEATRSLEALVIKRPQDEAVPLALASVQQRTGRPDQAEATLAKAFTAFASSEAVASAWVRYLLKKPDFTKALKAAQDAAGRNPTQAKLLELLGSTQEAVGAYGDAAKTFRELARRDPQTPAPWLRLAAVQARMNDLPAAIQSLKQARSALPDNESVAQNLATVYIASRRPDDALALAKDMQQRRPESAIGFVIEGDVRRSTERWADAEAAYRRALRAEPRSGAIAVAIAKLYSASGRNGDQTRFVDDWLASHPNDVTLLEHLAEVALQARDYRAVAQHYQTIVEQAPYSATALSRYAGALAKLRDARAPGLVDRALELSPDNVDALSARGTILIESGQPEQALGYLARAAQLAPDRLDIRFQRAVALMQSGRTQAGRAELSQLWFEREDFAGKADIPALLATR